MREELRDLAGGMKPALSSRVRKPSCFVSATLWVVLATSCGSGSLTGDSTGMAGNGKGGQGAFGGTGGWGGQGLYGGDTAGSGPGFFCGGAGGAGGAVSTAGSSGVGDGGDTGFLASSGTTGTGGAGGTGAACTGTICPVTIASGQALPRTIAVDGSAVYWANFNRDTIMRMPFGGVPVPIVSATGVGFFAIDGTSVYWTDGSGGRVMRTPLDGGPPVVLAAGQPGPGEIAVNATDAYWLNNGVSQCGVRGTIMKVALAGGTPEVIAELDLARVLALDATSVYWTNFNTVRKAPLGGGPATTLGVDPAGYAINDLTVDATSVYWPSRTAIMKLPIEGGTPVELATGAPNSLGGSSVKVNQTNVFWVGADGTIQTMPLGGGSKTVLATQQLDSFIAVDAQNVYWTYYDGTTRDGTIKRVGWR
jgi:hypothetical protein